MIKGFELYTLGAWLDVSGLIMSGKAHKVSDHPKQGAARRSEKKWDVILVGGVIASSLLLSTPNSAIAAPTPNTDLLAPKMVRPQSTQTFSLSPIREMNQSFNKLFGSIRTGQLLIPSDNVRLLAQKALLSQKEGVDIDSWAQSLANDIKVAND